ncbi:MAG: DUF5719 family protein [bacterium]|nr:DUF5719 family protein [bacterium]
MNGEVLRWPLIIVALATVIGLAVADRSNRQQQAASARSLREVVSAAAGPDARAGVWYCSEGTSSPGEFADHSVVVSNPTPVAVTAAVSVFPSTPLGSVSPAAPPEMRRLIVPGRSQAALRLAEVVESPYPAALVEVDSGSAVVEQRVQGPTGIDAVPCASRSSKVWHFAAGSTRRDSRLVFTLFNPFPDRAVVKLAFSTDEGVREPRELRGVLVPARSLVVVNATDLAPRFSSVATTVEAQAGRIVAGRLMAFDGTEGLEGLTAGPGMPEAATQWVFPSGPGHEGVAEHIVLYNPSERAATADISIRADASDAGDSQVPFEVSVPPRRQVALTFGSQGAYPLPAAPFSRRAADSLPEGSGFWAAIQVYNGVPIVAERVTAASTPPASAGVAVVASTLMSPAGVAVVAGTPVAAGRHLISANKAGGEQVALVVVNPSADSIARVVVSRLADGAASPIAELDPREVAPRSRLVVPIDRLVDGGVYALQVEASLPVLVFRSLLAQSGTGMSSANAVPFDPVPLDPAAF